MVPCVENTSRRTIIFHSELAGSAVSATYRFMRSTY